MRSKRFKEKRVIRLKIRLLFKLLAIPILCLLFVAKAATSTSAYFSRSSDQEITIRAASDFGNHPVKNTSEAPADENKSEDVLPQPSGNDGNDANTNQKASDNPTKDDETDAAKETKEDKTGTGDSAAQSENKNSADENDSDSTTGNEQAEKSQTGAEDAESDIDTSNR